MKIQTIFKTHKLPLVIVIGIVLTLTSCSSTHKAADKKLTEEDFTLTYKDKAQANGDIGKLILQHPLPISEQQIVFQINKKLLMNNGKNLVQTLALELLSLSKLVEFYLNLLIYLRA